MSNSDSSDENGNAYEWLADLSKRQCFTTCSAAHPAKTLDFGDEGFTASVTDRHQLVQLTRPDATCGLVYLRGSFPDNPGSILSRSQSRDDRVDFTNDTFGTTILPAQQSDEVILGDRKAQGWVNFRWPYTQFELLKKASDTGEILEVGTCEVLSFVSRGAVFQINRLKSGHGSSVTETEESAERRLETSGPQTGSETISDCDSAQTYARVRVEGKVRFGCPCANNSPNKTTPDLDTFKIRNTDGGGLHCTSDKYDTRLEVTFTENGVPWDFKRNDGARVVNDDDPDQQQSADLSCELRVRLLNGEATYLVSTYALRKDSEDDESDCSLELPPDLEYYLGVEWKSENMTDRLWTALCSTNYEAAEAVEFCVVGRCVEQILGVTSIPVRQPPRDSGPPQRAIINNIMTSQIVDVESAFYQIRLLTKIYNFIQTRKLEPDLLDPILSLEKIRAAYLRRIHPIIRACICWLFATNLKPDRLLLAVHSKSAPSDDEDDQVLTQSEIRRILSCSGNRDFLSWDQSYNRGCYATMAAWYAVKLCPEAIEAPGDHSFVNEIILPNLPVAFEFGKSRANRDKQPTPKGNVLGWLHFSVLLMLYEDFAWEENQPPLVFGNGEEFNRRNIEEAQQLFEKHVSRLKTSQGDGWSMEHEELDRVVLLAEEMAAHLGFDRFDSLRRSHSLAVARARHTRRRILNRKRTTKFNPGPRPWMAARGLSNGPWELLCTNHESYLRVADYANVISARDWVMEFLLSDYSFMSSWDRADANMVGRWWDIQPVAIVCSTLIDLRLEGKLPSAASIGPSTGETTSVQDQLAQSISNLQAAPTMHFDAAELTNPGAGTVPDPSAAQVAMLRVLIQQLKQSIEDSGKAQAYEIRQLVATSLATAGGDGIVGLATGKPFEWGYQKPSTLYYPEWWVKSTTDTAGINLDDLDLLDVIDISQTNTFTFKTSWKRTKHLPLATGHPGESHLARLASTGGRSRTAATTPLALTPVPVTGREHFPPITEMSPRANILTSPQFLKTVGQSLLDLGLKHRLFFVQRFSPSLKESLPRWHPNAETSIRDHFGASSRFAESRETSIWTTSITISHWTMRAKTEYEADPYRESGRQNGDFPPVDIAHLSKPPLSAFGSPSPLATTAPTSMEHIVEEQSTSLILTGDNQGYMWMCSILSPTVDSTSVARAVCDDKRGIPRLLKKFIHQQGSARCLVFLLLLGHVCEKLASGYNVLLKRLDDIMEIGDRTLIDGVDSWINTDESINKLKKMLWGWEALRVFNDKLSSSLFQIQRAQEAMEHIIKQDAAQQHVDLIQEYNSVMDEFKRRYGMLVDVHDKTQLKIKQVTGLRDGISTITNVVDTQTALSYNMTTIQQGNNIRTLTYITIAYLPLGLVCALYSLEEGTFMKGASNEMFGALIVGCSLGTYLLAYVLDKMLVKYENVVLIPKGLKTRLKRRTGFGLKGPTRAGGAFGGEDHVHGAVIELGDVPSRSGESPGKGWLSGITHTVVRETGESDGGLRGGTGGPGLFRRTSGSILV